MARSLALSSLVPAGFVVEDVLVDGDRVIVHHLGLALGGRPGAGFSRRLMLPVSNDTLLRTVRRLTKQYSDPVVVAGIDDWAFRRNHRYGTIVCDLERRRIVTLLPDREIPTVEAWLRNHPTINVLSRDRGGGYGEAGAKALPHAIQIGDGADSRHRRAVRNRGVRSATPNRRAP